jgi:hypothetical protein
MKIVSQSSRTSRGRREPRPWAPPITTLLLLVLTALVLQGACLPHTHNSAGVGLYNQEHDLTLYAASGAVAPLPVTPVLVVSVVTSTLVPPVPMAPAGFVTRDAESRAPPAS